MATPLYLKVLNEFDKNELNKLQSLKTKNGVTLDDIISPGKYQKDPSIGCFAGDAESYKIFAPFFDKVIKYYHGIDPYSLHKKDWDISKLKFDEDIFEDSRIISTRIRVARNLKEYPFEMCMNLKQRQEVEEKIIMASKSFSGELAGEYFPLSKMSLKTKEELISEHLLYADPREYMIKCGLADDWPIARGLYLSKDKKFSMWINEEDHLRVISMQQGGNIKEVFTRLINAVKTLEQKLNFAYDKHYGYLNTCPSNIGTAMRASVLVNLPNLGKNPDLKNFCLHFGVDVRGEHGEDSNDPKATIFDISNSRRLGITGVEVISFLSSGIEKILKMEDLFKK